MLNPQCLLCLVFFIFVHKNVYGNGFQEIKIRLRSLKFGPNPPKRPDLAEFGTLVLVLRVKKIFAICFSGSD